MLEPQQEHKGKGRKSTRIARELVTPLRIELYSINGQQLSCDRSGQLFKLTRKNTVELMEFGEQEFKIRLVERIFFQPEGPFKLDVEVVGTFRRGELTEEQVTEAIEQFATPIRMYSSFILTFVTERFGAMPIIFPPIKED